MQSFFVEILIFAWLIILTYTNSKSNKILTVIIEVQTGHDKIIDDILEMQNKLLEQNTQQIQLFEKLIHVRNIEG